MFLFVCGACVVCGGDVQNGVAGGKGSVCGFGAMANKETRRTTEREAKGRTRRRTEDRIIPKRCCCVVVLLCCVQCFVCFVVVCRVAGNSAAPSTLLGRGLLGAGARTDAVVGGGRVADLDAVRLVVGVDLALLDLLVDSCRGLCEGLQRRRGGGGQRMNGGATKERGGERTLMTLSAVFALVSMKMRPLFLAQLSPSSRETWRR